MFLATHDFGLLQAAALLELWQSDYVEPVVPPAIPYHVFIQQVLTLALQTKDFTRSDWHSWIGAVPAFAELTDGRAAAIIEHALHEGLLAEDGGLLQIGPRAEREFGYRHFSELLSVITSQPLFQVRFGRLEIGFVHPLSFAGTKGRPRVLALGGRGWRILHIDWDRKVAHAEPAQEGGRSRWIGSSAPLSPILCHGMRNVLASHQEPPSWSKRTREHISALRQELSGMWSAEDGSVIVRRGMSVEWWTFGGLAANQTVAQYLLPHLAEPCRTDNLWLKLPEDVPLETLREAIQAAQDQQDLPAWDLQDAALDLLKFGELLPEGMLRAMIVQRIADIPRALQILKSPIRVFEE